MNEKLELKHLAPYLPYSLKVIMEGEKTNVAWMGTKNIAVIRPFCVGDLKKISWKCAHLNIKPILSPLSQLTGEIEHNGEMFVPQQKLAHLYPNTPNWKYVSNDVWGFYHDKDLSTTFVEYIVLKKLIEWKFDVFGLIPKGLAIDMTTLNKGK